MQQEELEKINKKLIDILSKERGYFGRIDTWGQRPTKYEYIGYELDTDFRPILKALSDEKRMCLAKIITYFEMHAKPLKKIIDNDGEHALYDFYSEWAWSHFMTVVMFGMLEVAVNSAPSCIVWKDRAKGYINKYKSIELLLKTYLPQNIQDDIARRYKTEDGTRLSTFSMVIEHLWSEIRSGFIHEASIYCKGMEWNTLSGTGTKEDPIKIGEDVPMQEFLQVTWQAILNSFGYSGLVKLSKSRRS